MKTKLLSLLLLLLVGWGAYSLLGGKETPKETAKKESISTKDSVAKTILPEPKEEPKRAVASRTMPKVERNTTAPKHHIIVPKASTASTPQESKTEHVIIEKLEKDAVTQEDAKALTQAQEDQRENEEQERLILEEMEEVEEIELEEVPLAPEIQEIERGAV